MRETIGGAILVLLMGLTACQGGPSLDTRTFELEHLEAEEAIRAVRPYVFADREGSPGRISEFSGGVTVRETEDNLNKIERVLERLDRPRRNLRLNFQLIRADGTGSDPRIEPIESLLRELFRYEGYRLLDELHMVTSEGEDTRQRTILDGRSAFLQTRTFAVRSSDEGGSVQLAVELGYEGNPDFIGIATNVTIPLGETVVLGTSRVDPDGEPLILTVQPTLADSVPRSGEASRG